MIDKTVRKYFWLSACAYCPTLQWRVLPKMMATFSIPYNHRVYKSNKTCTFGLGKPLNQQPSLTVISHQSPEYRVSDQRTTMTVNKVQFRAICNDRITRT
jgi:hypothetical protein